MIIGDNALYVLPGERGTGPHQRRPVHEGRQGERCKARRRARVIPQVRAMVEAGIPVQGPLGLTPQSAAQFGGFKVQGKTAEAAKVLMTTPWRLPSRGCVHRPGAIPSPIAERITEACPVPTIGIGAGPAATGQVLVSMMYSAFLTASPPVS